MSPEERSLLANALRTANHRSPFWRRRLAQAGLTERHIDSGFPLDDLPQLSKAEILADQAAGPPFGSLLATPVSDVRRIHRTSGTTTTPMFIGLTERDIADTYVASERALRHAGMMPGERVVHCLNFNMWSGGVTDYLPIERLGATAVPFGVGNTTLLLNLIRSLGITAISSTPSYMFTLAERCRTELGIDPVDLGLRRGYFGGEGILQIPSVREAIEKLFGLVAVDANYGLSEVSSIIASEGPERDGLELHTHGILLTELVDENGRSLPLEPGAIGELVYSTLRREAQPLFRYKSGDRAEVIWSEIGEDGLLRMRFRVLGRTDQMLVIRGVNFFPESLLSIIAEFPQLGAQFSVVRPKAGAIDCLDVAMETNLEGPSRDALAKEIALRTTALLQVRIHIHWAKPGSLGGNGNKARFLVNSLSDLPDGTVSARSG